MVATACLDDVLFGDFLTAMQERGPERTGTEWPNRSQLEAFLSGP